MQQLKITKEKNGTFRIRYWENGKRLSKSFKSWGDASDFKNDLENDEISLTSLSRVEKEGIRYFKSLQLEIDLLTFIKKYSPNEKGSKTHKIGEIVESYLSNHPENSKKIQKRNFFKTFVNHFGNVPINNISKKGVEDFLSKYENNNSFNTYLSYVKLLFNHVECPTIQKLEKKSNKKAEIEIYTVDELKIILLTSFFEYPKLFASLVFFILTGIRLSEIKDISFDDINFRAKGNDEFRLNDGKTGARIVPLSLNAIKLLKLIPSNMRVGKVFKPKKEVALDFSQRVFAAMKMLFSKIDSVEKKNNSFRKTFITYSVCKDYEKGYVADICGNSIDIVRKYYYKPILRRNGEAEKFFEISPFSLWKFIFENEAMASRYGWMGGKLIEIFNLENDDEFIAYDNAEIKRWKEIYQGLIEKDSEETETEDEDDEDEDDEEILSKIRKLLKKKKSK